ncbi:MAG TPA: hypothetical protein V6D14_07585 [Coleofasciculaceae cyanobacterium]|jgi:hypothetical protein
MAQTKPFGFRVAVLSLSRIALRESLMQPKIIWQQNSDNPENGNNFAIIQQWWASLNDKKIAWRQRLIPSTGDVSQLDWEPQRFDEVFKLQTPQMRGITLYWRKQDSDQERSTTPRQLELDERSQQLYIYPQSQKELVIRVGIPEIIYQKISITNPQWEGTNVGENYILTLQDKPQQLEVKLTLTPENLAQLKGQLPQ